MIAQNGREFRMVRAISSARGGMSAGMIPANRKEALTLKNSGTNLMMVGLAKMSSLSRPLEASSE